MWHSPPFDSSLLWKVPIWGCWFSQEYAPLATCIPFFYSSALLWNSCQHSLQSVSNPAHFCKALSRHWREHCSVKTVLPFVTLPPPPCNNQMCTIFVFLIIGPPPPPPQRDQNSNPVRESTNNNDDNNISQYRKTPLIERFSKPNIRFGSGRSGSKIVSKFRLTHNRKLLSANRNTIDHWR